MKDRQDCVVLAINNRASPNGDTRYPFPLSPIFRRPDRAFLLLLSIPRQSDWTLFCYGAQVLISSKKALRWKPMPD